MTVPPRRRLALAVSVAGAMIVALDGSVLLVAQPRLAADLGASMAQVQWTSTAYLVAVAAFLVVAGRLGDRYGHRRLLLAGVLGFGAASAGIALVPGVHGVIALRAVQGVCGAMLQPATLALLRLTYPPDRLGTPIAVRTSAIAVAAGAGPLLGGVLVAQLGWRSVFWINVPAALLIAALVLAVRTPVPDRERTERLDLAGAGLLAVALAVLVHALAGVPEQGWAAATLLELLAVAVVGAVFVCHERRVPHPVVPPPVLRSVPVTASLVLLLVTNTGLFGTLFRATFHLQDELRLDPLGAGLRLVPLTACMILGAPVANAAMRRYGVRGTAVAGSGLVVAGIAALSVLGPAGTWAGMAVPFAAVGAGCATVMVTATGTVVGSAPPGYAGVVGGLKQTAMNVGPTLGIAVAAGVAGTAVSSLSSTLLVLAALTALGLLAASRLPRVVGGAESVAGAEAGGVPPASTVAK
ncbi:MFS transporter [Streptomyces fragilis]|uniref:MFS transporter n=2 Tax=Streptomyces fragilis TaxID=67301 RepID=A0ABV2YI32_9ACTN|nr:MFS transporter [Streptomyces fragilis]